MRATIPQLENEARRLCALRDIDPDDVTQIAHPTLVGITDTIPNWVIAAGELRNVMECVVALNLVEGPPAA